MKYVERTREATNHYLTIGLVVVSILFLTNALRNFGVGYYVLLPQLPILVDGMVGLHLLIAAFAKGYIRLALILFAFCQYELTYCFISLLAIFELNASLLRSVSFIPATFMVVLSALSLKESKRLGSAIIAMSCCGLLCCCVALFRYYEAGFASDFVVSIFKSGDLDLPSSRLGSELSASKILVILDDNPSTEIVINLPKDGTAVAKWQNGEWEVNEYAHYFRKISLVPAPQGVMVVETPDQTDLFKIAKNFFRKLF